LLSGTWGKKLRLRARRLAFATACKRLQSGVLKRIGLCKPVNGHDLSFLNTYKIILFENFKRSSLLGVPGIEQQDATGFHIGNISGHDRHFIKNTLRCNQAVNCG
jgi:hypothetical protein